SREHLPGELDTRATVLVEELAAAKIVVVGLDVLRGHFLDCPLFVFTQDNAKRFRNVLRDLVLNREDVFDLTIVSLGPELISICDVDELHADADFISHLAHTSLENGGHLELFPDFTNVFSLALVCER